MLVIQQGEEKLKQISKRMQDGKIRDQYAQKCQNLCKKLKWACNEIIILYSVLKSHPDQNEVFVCYQLIYFRVKQI